jgi:3-hydroxybutyryl-CoA dehydrogenase
LRQIEVVLVVGAGWVGRQIAMTMAAGGCRVSMYDRDESVLRQALEWTSLQATRLVEAGTWSEVQKNNARENLSGIHQSKVFSQGPDLVIECVPEQASLKKRVLRELGDEFDEDVILSSNSSYFVPSMFQGAVRAPERFVHYHFHVPVFLTNAVDIMPWQGTAAVVVERLVELSNRIGQKPFVCRREHTGYVFNWLLQALLKAAMELAQQGVADPHEIDQRWKDLTGMKRGPFWIMDQIGLDVIQQVLQNGRFTQPMAAEVLIEFLEPLVSAGKLGQKAGEGFFSYSDRRLDWEEGSNEF